MLGRRKKLVFIKTSEYGKCQSTNWAFKKGLKTESKQYSFKIFISNSIFFKKNQTFYTLHDKMNCGIIVEIEASKKSKIEQNAFFHMDVIY